MKPLMVLLLLLVGCQAPVPAPATAPVSVADETALLARLRQHIGEAPCSADAQCRTLAIGHKACGGPAAYWAWSSANTSAAQVEPLAQELALEQRERQKQGGMMSDCRLVTDPGASCRASRCVLNERAGAR